MVKYYVDTDMLESLRNDLSTKHISETTDLLILNDNTEYRLSSVSSIALSYPQGNFEAWLRISFAQTGVISVSFPSETKYIGAAPTFDNGQTWEISIKDGVAVCWRVE